MVFSHCYPHCCFSEKWNALLSAVVDYAVDFSVPEGDDSEGESKELETLSRNYCCSILNNNVERTGITNHIRLDSIR